MRQMEVKYYAGIGSRSTPEDVLDRMYKLAILLAKRSYTLRSGGANGADTAFEKGCTIVNGSIDLWLPWNGFNKRKKKGSLTKTEDRKRVRPLPVSLYLEQLNNELSTTTTYYVCNYE